MLKFLELPSLIITDLDSVKLNVSTGGKKSYPSCLVHEGTRTSNACIKKWFDAPEISPQDLIIKDTQCKIADKIRLAYQIPEQDDAPCGRTLEDAFILANRELFEIEGGTPASVAKSAATQAARFKKSEFALRHALSVKEWKVPKYIEEGLLWLRSVDNNTVDLASKETSEIQATLTGEGIVNNNLAELLDTIELSDQ